MKPSKPTPPQTVAAYALAALLTVAGLACGSAQELAERPNVLFIVVDDLNVALGAYGAYPTAKTPHLDRLASAAVRFDRAYAQDPLCNPSRTSFLSGRRPPATDVYGNFTAPRHKLGEVAMLPEYFRSRGYFTARVGKVAHGRYEDSVSWDVSENAARREHYLPGVDRSEVRDNSWIEGAEDGLSRAEILEHVGRPTGMPLTWRATDESESETPDGRTTRRVIELMRQPRDKPFFLSAGYHKPHQPWVAPASFFEQHPVSQVRLPAEPADDRSDIPAAALGGYPEDKHHSEAQQRQAIAAYHATVTLIDHQVGLLLAALEGLHLDRSTIVVFVSDHGFHLGEHGGLWRKHTQFEESTRVPLIVRAPGARAGAATSALVELVDLYPTLVDLCGLPQPDGLEGTSFRPVLENPDLPWKSAVFSEAQRGGAHGRSVRTARYRFTEWKPLEGGGEAEFELYDLEADPREFHNLAALPDRQELRGRLARTLAAGWRGALPGAE